ncbi:MAG TPA: transcriptional repressor LexA [Flexilinea sp.]|jgi:repressor LexA|nr:repressor LexA [Flexilinea sp.]OQA27852.1 MAG: LexA repressor [Chloroflexi bacterium ADurb.Bin344]HNY93633.1 transcriptional repressor LexA [Flexilinea sp.]HOG21747.1 transcriptional repressor LexA [Flexilinea sp.]HOG59749.1 transcriptional repressor LexA [Flexilinea sp.]
MARMGKMMNDRHRKIMLFLEEYQKNNQFSPSIREIGNAIGVNSTSLVDYYLRQLAQMGYLERNDRVSRSIRILKPFTEESQTAKNMISYSRQEVLRYPILGRIVASEPIPVPGSDLAYFDPESYIEIPKKMIPASEKETELFVLEVSGDSMVDAMINDGDKVVFRQANQASNGDMVAVWLSNNDETTLKYFYREGSRVRLQPANPTMGPIYIDDPEQVHIMGKVVMVIRHL